jgi:hypothetical protein
MLPFALIEAELGSAVQEGVRLVGVLQSHGRVRAQGPSQSEARSHPDETEAVRPAALDAPLGISVAVLSRH